MRAALREVMRELGSTLTRNDLVTLTVESAVMHTRAFGAYLEKADLPGARREVEVIAVAGRGVPPTGTRAPYPGSLTDAILASGEPERTAEVGWIGESMAPYLAERCPRCTGLVVPLLSEGEVLGAMILLRAAEQAPFDEEEAEFARMLGDAAAAGIRRVTLIEERTEALERQRFLSEASRVLSSSLDYAGTLHRVARLAVPEIADWCTVDVIEDGKIERLAAVHTDPRKLEMARELGRRYPADPDAPRGVPNVLRSGEPELYARIDDAQLRAAARDESHLEILRQVGMRSAMIVPMRSREGVLGAITFVEAESGGTYDADDLVFAEELAARAATAVENARLYREAQAARREAERRAVEEGALRRAAEAVSAAFTLQEVVHQIAHSALEATQADGAIVKRLEILTREVEVVAAAGEAVPPIGSRLPYDGSVTQHVIEHEKPEVVRRLRDAEWGVGSDLVDLCGDCSAVVVPLLDAGNPIGALVLLRSPTREPFLPDEVARAFAYGNLAALAFRKMHLIEDTERRREELERVTESRARLMRGFSHDLKNPLNAADGFAQLLEEGVLGPLAPRQAEGVQRIRRLLASSVRLIEDLLELARTESGEIDVKRSATDVRETVREMAEAYRPQAETKGLRIEMELPEVFEVVESDADRIRQILGNLLSNAVKYTPRGHVTVRVDVRGRGTEGGERWIAVDVEDTGPGISESDQALLFEEFVRLQHGMESGAGVGLAIGRRIAQALGGDITLESEVGRGSRFTLWLPTHPVL